MYEQFYNLSKPPFANIPDPEFLYLSPQHKRGLATLKYALLTRAGFCVVTGDVGAGKTTLIRRLLQEIDVDIDVGVVSNTQCDSFEEFLRWILLSFDLDYKNKDKVEMYDDFVRYMIAQYDKGLPVTLIIDEAQHLGFDILEQLRMLSNVNTEKGQVLQTILVGQPELWDLLRRPELSQFAQRISYDYFLAPLESVEATGEFIKHRLQQAGGEEAIFLPETYAPIFEATAGVPRLINLVCDTSLVYGYAQESENIDKETVKQVLIDKEGGFSPIGKRRNSAAVRPIYNERTQRGARDEDSDKTKGKDTKKRSNRQGKVSTIERAAIRLEKDV